MTDTLTRILRTAIFAILALLGMAMALVFMLSTAIAVGVLYIVARLRGKPFGIRAYWNQRNQAYGFASRPFGSSPFGATAGQQPAANAGTRKQPPRSLRPRPADVIDVDVREVN